MVNCRTSINYIRILTNALYFFYCLSGYHNETLQANVMGIWPLKNSKQNSLQLFFRRSTNQLAD